MKQYLVQLEMGDEWHRVLLGERRDALGIAVVSIYFEHIFIINTIY